MALHPLPEAQTRLLASSIREAESDDLKAFPDGRTLKDSILRSLRRLLEAQDEMRRCAPDLILELTHEIYCNTPGVGGDLAVLEHTSRYHMSPNHLSGFPPAGPRQKSVEAIRKELIYNCFFSRQRFFENRGLPLYGLESYGATTASYKGSLTPELSEPLFTLGTALHNTRTQTWHWTWNCDHQ